MTHRPQIISTESPANTVEPQAWYESEVPSIVSGLQSSRSISDGTAATAWQLIEDGSYDRALSVALSEAI